MENERGLANVGRSRQRVNGKHLRLSVALFNRRVFARQFFALWLRESETWMPRIVLNMCNLKSEEFETAELEGWIEFFTREEL